MGERPQAIGGFADVWIGSYSGFMVAVKVLKESEGNLKRVKKVSAILAVQFNMSHIMA